MKIRNYTDSDLFDITEIYNYHILNTTVLFETEPFAPAKMKKMINTITKKHPVIVAEESDRLLGFAYVHSWKEKPAYSTTAEFTVYVREDCKRQGVGTALIKSLVAMCASSGLHVLIACITADNIESIKFHEKHGFKQVSHFQQVGRKFGRWLDIVDLQLILN